MNFPRILALSLILFVVACKKESAPEPAPVSNTSVFTLESAGTECSVVKMEGNFIAGTALNNTNIVVIQVNVSRTGKYFISTSLENNYYFVDTGTFVNTGVQSITLKGTGTPYGPGNSTFNLTAGGTTCKFIVTVTLPANATIDENDHMFLGNPSNAASSLDSVNNYLMRKPFYALSYSRDKGGPNWVSWHLFNEDLGSTKRQDDFRPDNTLPIDWYHVPEYAFNGSGFDRGHCTPSGDRTVNVAANSQTFLMSNMIPQAPNQNQITWAKMEDSLRALVYKGNELYIIMGVYGIGGTGNNGLISKIDGGRVTVPANIWKVAVVIPNGFSDSSRINSGIRVIAVDVPNSNTANSNWKNYRVSVDAIEAATGYNLLSRLPVSVQADLESKVDNL